MRNSRNRLMRVNRLLGVILAGMIAAACVRHPLPVPVEPDAPPPPPPTNQTRRTPPPPSVPPPAPSPPPAISEEEELESRSLEDLNRESPLRPVFFDYDRSEVSSQGQVVLQANAEVLRRNPSWVITIEGHCDERGSPEYNLGLGERRALMAQEYLLGLGLASDRINTVSYGKEFPFESGRTAEALSRNRRAHFVITDR
jgi:peptidoglycan-associated lipoprotein